MHKKDIKRYLIIALLIILVFISYLIIKPFITAIIAAAILSYLLYPIHKKLSQVTNNTMSAVLITLLIIIIILLPLVSITKTIIKESSAIKSSETVQTTIESVTLYIEESDYDNLIKDSISKSTEFIQKKASKFLLELPLKIFEFLVTIYAFFAFLLLGEETIKKLKKLIPAQNKEEIIKNIKYTTNGIVYGMFITAILQFIIAFITFKIIGTSAALLLALIIGLLAFIPMLGPAIIWLPYAVIEFTKKDYTSAIILLILGAVLFLIDSILKSKIISSHAKLHPVIILIGIFGGITLFGIVGLVAGPVILSILATIIESHYQEIKHET